MFVWKKVLRSKVARDGWRQGRRKRTVLHSVVGSRCRIGSRVTTVSANSDGSTIQSVIKGKAIDSKRRYLGAIIADDSVIGDRCTVNAGVKMWPNQLVAADSELVIDSMPDPAVWVDHTSRSSEPPSNLRAVWLPAKIPMQAEQGFGITKFVVDEPPMNLRFRELDDLDIFFFCVSPPRR